MSKTILLTGAAGKLGRRLRLPLAQRYAKLRISDIVPLEAQATNEEVVACDLSDASAVAKLVAGVDAIVHFAGYPREADWATLIPANIVGTINLFEEAKKAGVRRLIYASSNHVIGFHPSDRKIDLDAEVKADTRYGVTKAFAETLARFYYEKFGLESLGLRIGRCEDKPTDARMLSTWLHPEDMVQLVTLGIDAPVKADLIYGVSHNSRGWWSNHGLPDFPYKPLHSADDYVLPASDTPAQNWRYQGGHFADGEYVGDPERAANFNR